MHRDQWEAVLEKLRSGQTPPPGIPRPAAADLRDMMDRITNELAPLDRLVKPDPGHITARRLNLTEYDNSVRDLLGVERAGTDLRSTDRTLDSVSGGALFFTLVPGDPESSGVYVFDRRNGVKRGGWSISKVEVQPVRLDVLIDIMGVDGQKRNLAGKRAGTQQGQKW